MANTDGNIIIGTSVDVGGINTGLNKITKSFKKLAALTGTALGVKGLVNLGKAAINAASDLAEVQNIVDVAFGEMSYKIEDFAKVCIDSFGISEFSAKQTAGSFMAMGKAMGIDAENASNMAVNLTALTADMSSFLNISQDYARVALSAVYSGETETLKRYGIVLTEANLQEFAQQKGITKSVKAMTSREKAMLRYEYIVQQTQHMVGDFQRTQDQWANSVRVLQQRWTEFLLVLGSGLTSTFAPLLKVLEKLIVRFTQFAKVIGAILVNIFGIQMMSASKGTETLGDTALDAADAEDELADATKAAGKAAKKSLAAWDDLNVLQQDTASGGSGGAGGDEIEFDIPEFETSLEDVDGLVDEITSEIDTLYGLGKYLSDTFANLLKNISWDNVYERAQGFGKGLAEFLNGLVQPDNFAIVGETIANSLNTVITSSLAFTTEFDFKNLGIALADEVNSFFDNFNFADLADAIDGWVQGLFEMVKEFVTHVEWKDVFAGIGEFLGALDVDTIDIILGVLAIKGIGKILFDFTPELFGKMFEQAFLQGNVADTISRVFTTIVESVANGASPVAAMGEAFGFMGAFMTAAAGIASVLGGLILAAQNFFDMWNEGFSALNETFMLIGIALAAVGAILLGAPAVIAGVVAAIVAIAANLIIYFKKDIFGWFSGVYDTYLKPMITAVKNTFDTITKNSILPFIETVKSFIGTLTDTIMAFIDNVLGPVIQWIVDTIVPAVTPVITTIVEIVMGLFSSITWVVKGIIEVIQGIIDFIVGVFTGDWEKALGGIYKIFEGFASILRGAVEFLVTAITGIFTLGWTTLTGLVSAGTNTIKKIIDGTITTVKNVFTTLFKVGTEFIKNGLTKIANIFKNIFTGISDTVTSIVQGLGEMVKGSFNFMIGIVEGFANGIIRGINAAINALKAMAFTAPDWVPVIGGQSVAPFAGLPTISEINIPRLATGAVIPPNKEFMAVLGDQKSGTNIEAPLDTIIQAMRTALGGMQMQNANQNVTLEIDGTVLARMEVPYMMNELNRLGYNVSILEG